MINIISNESNNQVSDKILNITTLTKHHKFVYTFFELTDAMKLDAKVISIWIFEKINQLTKPTFKKVNSVAIDTCSLEHTVWNIFDSNPCP